MKLFYIFFIALDYMFSSLYNEKKVNNIVDSVYYIPMAFLWYKNIYNETILSYSIAYNLYKFMIYYKRRNKIYKRYIVYSILYSYCIHIQYYYAGSLLMIIYPTLNIIIDNSRRLC